MIYVKSFSENVQTPTQKLKSEFLKFSSQKISSSLVSLKMIFAALQSEFFRLNFQTEFEKSEKSRYFFVIFPTS